MPTRRSFSNQIGLKNFIMWTKYFMILWWIKSSWFSWSFSERDYESILFWSKNWFKSAVSVRQQLEKLIRLTILTGVTRFISMEWQVALLALVIVVIVVILLYCFLGYCAKERSFDELIKENSGISLLLSEDAKKAAAKREKLKTAKKVISFQSLDNWIHLIYRSPFR